MAWGARRHARCLLGNLAHDHREGDWVLRRVTLRIFSFVSLASYSVTTEGNGQAKILSTRHDPSISRHLTRAVVPPTSPASLPGRRDDHVQSAYLAYCMGLSTRYTPRRRWRRAASQL